MFVKNHFIVISQSSQGLSYSCIFTVLRDMSAILQTFDSVKITVIVVKWSLVFNLTKKYKLFLYHFVWQFCIHKNLLAKISYAGQESNV